MDWRLLWRGIYKTLTGLGVCAVPKGIAQKLIQRADKLRDERQWAQAAVAYQRVLEQAPNLDHIWIQHGHALKEAGDHRAAEAAYSKAVETNPRSVDAHVQLGHMLKNRGDTKSAATSFANALEIDHGSHDALRELIALGKGAIAATKTTAGLQVLGEVRSALAVLKRATFEIEKQLPDIQSLCSVPVNDFSLFSARFRLPPAPELPVSPWWSAVVLDDRTSDVLSTIRSVAAQSSWKSVYIVSARPSLAMDLQQISHAGLSCPVIFAEGGSLSDVSKEEWLFFVKAGTELVPFALPWMKWAAAQVDSLAIYADEELVERNVAGEVVSTRGYFKSAYDIEAGSSYYESTMLAVHESLWRQVSSGSLSSMIDELEHRAATAGKIGHLPRVLSRRNTFPWRVTSGAAKMSTSGDRKIAVIVPTRDGGADLKKCLFAVEALADMDESIEIVVIDNGSAENATCDYLQELANNANTRVLRDEGPFNWARLSNEGAHMSSADILVFLNDDVELRTKGWDSYLRRHLERPEIGAVGCKLLYHDGAIQHGGIVFGPDGRTAHEGIGEVTPESELRWNNRRVVGAVTGAFLACRRSDFENLRGFDEVAFPVWFNDIDFCLRLRALGLRILYEPEVSATHRESATLKRTPESNRQSELWHEALREMGARWGSALIEDPGFNPHFLRTGRPFEALLEPSLESITSHLRRSSFSNPWLVSQTALPLFEV